IKAQEGDAVFTGRHENNHCAQSKSRCRVRSEHQSLSRLRALLHLLFRAADPRVSRIFSRSRFRITHHGEARRAAIARSRVVVAEMETAAPDDERGDRLLSTGRAQAADHSKLAGG